jgi:hypothetical protein
MSTTWEVINCSSACTNAIPFSSSLVITTSSELTVPARALDLGLYQLKLTVTMQGAPHLTSSVSVHVRINPSGVTANLIPLGTSIVTSGQQRDLLLNPGSYSIDPDTDVFNANVSTLQASIAKFSRFS